MFFKGGRRKDLLGVKFHRIWGVKDSLGTLVPKEEGTKNGAKTGNSKGTGKGTSLSIQSLKAKKTWLGQKDFDISNKNLAPKVDQRSCNTAGSLRLNSDAKWMTRQKNAPNFRPTSTKMRFVKLNYGQPKGKQMKKVTSKIQKTSQAEIEDVQMQLYTASQNIRSSYIHEAGWLEECH